MGWFAIKTVWFKELVDTVRDKRTLYMMVLLPLVLMPLIFLVGPILMQRQEKALNESLPIIVLVGNEADALIQWLTDTESVQVSNVPQLGRDEAEQSVRSGDFDLVVYVQDRETQDGVSPVTMELVFESHRGTSLSALRRFEGHLERYSAEVVTGRVTAMGLSPDLLEPFQIMSIHDLTTEDQMGGRLLGMILPFLISIWAVTGGMYTAIDVAAGEKERGTLESLIMAPVSRGALVFGKFLAIVTVAFTAVVLLIMSMLGSILYLMPRIMGEDALSLGFSIQPVGLVMLLLVMALFIAMIAALLLVLSAFGKSFREGQAYTTGLMFLVMVPGMYFTFVDEITVANWTYAVPVFNVMLVLRELLEGRVDWAHLGITLSSLALCAGLAIFMSFRVFLDERVLFRA